MDYKVWNNLEGKYEDDCVLTQDGKIAFWDESGGWSSDFVNQENYSITEIHIDNNHYLIGGNKAIKSEEE